MQRGSPPDLEAGRAEAELALSLSVRSVSARRAAYAVEEGDGRMRERPPPQAALRPQAANDPSTSQAARALALDSGSGDDMAAEEWAVKANGKGGLPTSAPPLPPPPKPSLFRRRRVGAATSTSTCAPSLSFPLPASCFAIPRRPNTWDFKTREAEWRARHSMWRYVQGTFFFIGPPDFLWRESESVQGRCVGGRRGRTQPAAPAVEPGSRASPGWPFFVSPAAPSPLARRCPSRLFFSSTCSPARALPLTRASSSHHLIAVWPPVLFNSAIALLVAADYVLTIISPTGSRWAYGFLPDRTTISLANMESLTRMMLLAVSLLATWRVNR